MKNIFERKEEMPLDINKGFIERCDPFVATLSGGVYAHMQRYLYASRFAFGKALDLGCGVGYGSYILANSEKVSKVTAIDISPSALKYAKKYYHHQKIEYIQRNVDNLPFDDDFFDTIIAFEIIEHVKNYEKVIKEIYRVLKNGSYLFISSPNPRDILNRLRHYIFNKPYPVKYQDNPHHIKEFGYEEMVNILTKNKFEVENSYGQMFRLPILYHLLRIKHFHWITVNLAKPFPRYSLTYVIIAKK
jgi:ubiquinone/menaquinone biosynthesis C-methylase UbiE